MKKVKINKILICLTFVFSGVYLFSQPPDSYTVSISDKPAPGYLFIGPNSGTAISLVDNSGVPVHVTQLNEVRSGIVNFNKWQNGLATFWNRNPITGYMAFYAINDAFQVVDTFQVSSAFQTDFHEFQWLSNGHYLMLGEDFRTIDMSQIVPGGSTNARVRGMVIQEFDANHDLIWQWNSFDHLAITDATNDINLTEPTINYCHINSAFLDYDGNVVISSRHLDEITKINKATGDIIWRMGGSSCKNNQFTFINDTQNNYFGFSHQHDVQRLSNGHLLVFDNGNLKPSQYTRAVEYEVDEVTKTVSKVWEYRHVPDIFSESQGGIQKLPNGNTLISWSSNSMNITCTEIDQLGTTVFEMSATSTASYRVYKYVFKMASVTKDVNSATNYNFNESNNSTHIALSVYDIDGTGEVQLEEHYYAPHNLAFTSTPPWDVYPARWVMTSKTITGISGKMIFDIDSVYSFQSPERLIIFYRPNEGTGNFSALNTSYNSTTKKLETTFNGFGEYLIGLPDIDKPVLDSPINDYVETKIPVKLTWKQLFNAVSYRLQVATNSSFNSIILDTAGIRDTSFVANKNYLSNYTKYFWRVNAVKNGQTTSWTDAWNFTTELPPPALDSPNDSALNIPLKINLSWANVVMAESFRFQMSESREFSSLIVNSVINKNSFDYGSLKYNKEYFWRVSSINGNYSSRWSVIRSFKTKLNNVNLLLPFNNTTDINPNLILFSWNALDGANQYHLQISRDSMFATIDKDIHPITDTFFLETGLVYNEKYFWRVSGFGQTASGDWSVVRNIITTIPAPALIQPINKSKNLTIGGILRWENYANSLSYHLQIATDSLFKNVIDNKDDYNGFTYSYQNLEFDKKYYWRVLVYTKNGSCRWSVPWEFQIRQEFYVDKPVLKTPEIEQYNIPITGKLYWDAVPGVISYKAQLSLDNTFEYPILDLDGLTKTEMEYGILNYNKEYYWRVMANGEKAKSDWSETGTFYTKLETPNLFEPEDNSDKVKINTHFSWTPIDGATEYIVQFSKETGFSQNIEQTENYNLLTNIDMLAGFTRYYWRVMGTGGKKESDWSYVWSFTTAKLNGIEDNVSVACEVKSYPNPFTDFMIISFQTNLVSDISISIFSLDDKCQQSIVQQKLNIGFFSIYLNTAGWNDGIYFIKIKVNNEIKINMAIKCGK